MRRGSACYLLAAPLLAFLAGGWLHPAFSASPAGPAISGYAATNPHGVPIFSAPPGAPMLIEGQNLGMSGTIAFNGIPAPPAASWSPTEILVTVPVAPSYPFQGPITITTGGQAARGPSFTITPPPPPPVPPPGPLQPGELDPSFGSGGTVLTAFGGSPAMASAVALQPDGRIVVAGSVIQGCGAGGCSSGFALARYTANGSLDPAFGTGGQVLTEFGGSEAASAVAVQPDGRIIVAGRSDAGGQGSFALARYHAGGSLDASFGAGGRVLTEFGGVGAGATALALQPDGRIVASGDFALARYNSDGSLDTRFGSGGKVLAHLGTSALALQPNGAIVVVGTNSGLERYHADGTLDPSFGTGGRVLIGWDGGANSVAVQSDGRILVAGTADDGDGHPVFALARYHADGSPDAAFGAGGQVRAEFGGSAGADALALQPDGRIVVAGSATNGCGAGGCSSVFALARCNADGSLDTSFGIDGRVLTGIANADAAASALALQPDGQIVLAGSANGSTEFALARYQGH